MDSGGDDGRLRGDGQRPALLPGMRRVFDGLGAFKRRSLLLTAGILAECLEGSVLLLRESAALLQQRLGRLLCSSCQGSGVLGPGRRAERAWLLCVCYAKNASRWLRDLFRGLGADFAADDSARRGRSCCRHAASDFSRPGCRPLQRGSDAVARAKFRFAQRPARAPASADS